VLHHAPAFPFTVAQSPNEFRDFSKDIRPYAGGKHFQLDPYYEHENNTGKHPNQQVNAGGLVLNVYFPWREK
jgi:hypothetical protein